MIAGDAITAPGCRVRFSHRCKIDTCTPGCRLARVFGHWNWVAALLSRRMGRTTTSRGATATPIVIAMLKGRTALVTHLHQRHDDTSLRPAVRDSTAQPWGHGVDSICSVA